MNKYIYSFRIDFNNVSWPKSVSSLMFALSGRLELVSTERDFNQIREECRLVGLGFLEIERVLYQNPEKVK